MEEEEEGRDGFSGREREGWELQGYDTMRVYESPYQRTGELHVIYREKNYIYTPLTNE